MLMSWQCHALRWYYDIVQSISKHEHISYQFKTTPL